jgi:hypothetical protein
MSSGLELIAEHRTNVVVANAERNLTALQQATGKTSELAWQAATYAAPCVMFGPKPTNEREKRIVQLAIAGAFCAAEIDRLQRGGEL